MLHRSNPDIDLAFICAWLNLPPFAAHVPSFDFGWKKHWMLLVWPQHGRPELPQQGQWFSSIEWNL
jgi:hypothetical protein